MINRTQTKLKQSDDSSKEKANRKISNGQYDSQGSSNNQGQISKNSSLWSPGHSSQGVLWYGNRAEQKKRRLGRTQQN